MSDLISRKAIIKAIEELPNCYNGWSNAYDKAYIITTIEEVPTTINLVRCEECEYWDDIECQNDRASTDLEGGAEYALYRDDTDFCSYGERRTDETQP